MTDLLFARSQMGMSLAFHIVFAAIGISLPVLMVTSEARTVPVTAPTAKRMAAPRDHRFFFLFRVFKGFSKEKKS